MASSSKPSSSSTVSASSVNNSSNNSARFDKQQISSSSSYTVREKNFHGLTSNAISRPKVPSSRRSVTPNSRSRSSSEFDEGSERVRVAVRVRPRNAEELLPDSDFVDYIELQPEVIMGRTWSSLKKKKKSDKKRVLG